MQPRAEWLADVESASRLGRSARAFRHDSISRAALLDCDCDRIRPGQRYDEKDRVRESAELAQGVRSFSRCSHKRRSKWHGDRAKGQLRRFDRVARCGTDKLTLFCGSCSRVHGEQPATCDDFRACVHCRGRRAAALRKRFAIARKTALRRFAAYRAWRAREVFTTLTYPDSGNPAADAAAIVGAWPTFIASVRSFLQCRYGMPRALTRTSPFLRVLEATPGTDNRGHAHLHFWAYAPYLPHQLLRLWWAAALDAPARERLPLLELQPILDAADERDREYIAAAADGATHVRWPVLDIQACHGDPGRELIKYLVKDQEKQPDGTLVQSDPVVFAELYNALEGRRTLATSLHFWELLPPNPCVKCGAVGATKVEATRDHFLKYPKRQTHAPP